MQKFKMMMKQIWKSRYTILKSVWNKYFKYSKNRDVALDRLQICRKCPYNSYNKAPFGTTGEYTNLPYEHCTVCGCSIFLKIYSEWEKYPNTQYNPCPKKYWKK